MILSGGMIDNMQTDEIEKFLLNICDSDEYKKIKYLVFSIRPGYLKYISMLRTSGFTPPEYLQGLISYIDTYLYKNEINPDNLLNYMLENDDSNWVHYFDDVFFRPTLNQTVAKHQVDKTLFYLVLIGFVFDSFRENAVDIQTIFDNEKMIYKTNSYKLSIVNDVEFHRDYFVFDNKAYLYNLLTNTSVLDFTDDMPGFARIITNSVHTGNILLRLDERLALPKEQAISYSTLNFEKYYGPNFCFDKINLKFQKTITVHIDNSSLDKLLMVIKKDYDTKKNENFLHIEIETLPYITCKRDNMITEFLHGMYYPMGDYFTHIDYTRNQYKVEDYVKKYTESTPEVPIDFYADKQLHYKIWCIEGGEYSRKVWYELMIASLERKYQNLLNEMLSENYDAAT